MATTTKIYLGDNLFNNIALGDTNVISKWEDSAKELNIEYVNGRFNVMVFTCSNG